MGARAARVATSGILPGTLIGILPWISRRFYLDCSRYRVLFAPDRRALGVLRFLRRFFVSLQRLTF
jgi:hypothetical protein